MSVPQSVLSEHLSEILGNRTVNSALFTTFSFDPGFFELHILPLLFPNQKFSEVEKVRLIQLEDCVRTLKNLAVYYDANALAHDGDTPKLGYDRIDVHWQRGVFHPKIICLLVDEPESESQGTQSLIVCCQSANITRAGWWENVECAHVEEVKDKRTAEHPCSFRNDLMSFLVRIRRSLPKESHDALDDIHHFIRYRTNPEPEGDTPINGAVHTRLFGASRQLNFADWLKDEAEIPEGWNLEVISPYFDKNNASALVNVVEATAPRRTRVFLPQSEDGTALVSEAVYDQIESIDGVRWAQLPEGMLQRKGASTLEKLAPRFVHAKVYRFWKRQQPDLIVVGSINCTTPAHGGSGRKNLEAGFLIDASNQRLKRQWWLEKFEDESVKFIENVPDEADGNDRALFDVVVKYNWERNEVEIRLDGKLRFPITFTDLTDKVLFSLDSYDDGEWNLCDQAVAEKVHEAIRASSFINVQCHGSSWRVLIREESFSHRPSLLTELSPDEILKYWSLLSPEQRTAFLEKRLVDSVEGLETSSGPLIDTTESVFHRFSGIFHAFGHLRRHLQDCLDKDRVTDAEFRFFGAKYDSLPELLRKMIEKEGNDPLYVYITFLTAKQLRDGLAKDYKWFVDERKSMLRDLDCLIRKGLRYRDRIQLDSSQETSQFLSWYESMFLKEFGS